MKEQGMHSNFICYEYVPITIEFYNFPLPNFGRRYSNLILVRSLLMPRFINGVLLSHTYINGTTNSLPIVSYHMDPSPVNWYYHNIDLPNLDLLNPHLRKLHLPCLLPNLQQTSHLLILLRHYLNRLQIVYDADKPEVSVPGAGAVRDEVMTVPIPLALTLLL
nr:hypothetical protein MACL_00000656 [Theileria orientalis]